MRDLKKTHTKKHSGIKLDVEFMMKMILNIFSST